MAEAASKATMVTTLAIGSVEVPVGLFSTKDKPGSVPDDFTTAGPNGGVLKAQAIARPTPVDETVERPAEPVHADPLAEDPFVAVLDETLNRVRDASWDDAARRDAIEVATGAPSRHAPREIPPEVAEKAIEAQANLEQAKDDVERWFGGGSVDGEYGRQLVEEGSGVVVAPEDVRRGIRLEDGTFIDCTERLAKITEDTKLNKIDVLGFVDSTAIPRLRVQAAYYIGATTPEAPAALRLLWEGLRRTRRAGVAKLTKKSRQSLGAIVVYRDTLVVLELVFAADFRPAPQRALALQSVAVSDTQVQMMVDLIHAKSAAPAVIDELSDDAITLREELRQKALRGEIEAIAADLETRTEDDRLLAQLEASLAGAP